MEQAWANGQWQTCTYDGDGRRVRRTDPALGEIWQVYGLDGELLAEYGVNGAAILPKKEYGYRNGQLLITAANGDGLRLWNFMKNVAVRFGVYGSAIGDSQLLSAANALSTAGAQGQSQMLSAARTQVQNVIMWSNIPSDADYVTALYLSYLQRFPDSNELNAWVSEVPTIGRDAVRDGFAYSNEFTARVNNLWGMATTDTERTDAFVQYVYNGILHRSANGSEDATAISTLDNAGATGQANVIAAANDLARNLFNSSEYTSRPGLTPHDFVYDLSQTLYGSPPDGSWDYWTDQVGANWENKQTVLDHFINAGPFDQKAGTLYREVLWLTPDHLGTPRMIAERTGSLAGIKRHDYLPFGEELFAGSRTAQLGYTNNDGARQKFTLKDRDNETGLDYFEARYYASTQGRFTSVDPAKLKLRHFANPQDLNRYAYVANNPLAFFDPDGEEKVKIIIRTFIPEKTVTVPGGVGGDPGLLMPANKTYQGDDRKVGEHPERFRTEQIIMIETDRSKNGNGKDIVVSNDTAAGLSRRLFSDGSSIEGRATPKSDARGVYTMVGQDFITVTATASASNPLNAQAPPISYSIDIDIFSGGSKGDLYTSASGNRNEFPGVEIYIERPETSNQSGHLIYSYNPEDENRGPFRILVHEDFVGHEKKIPPE